MNLNKIYESDIEETALEWLAANLDYTVLHGPDIAPDTPDAERSSYNEVILTRRLQDAVARLNPEYTSSMLKQEAIQQSPKSRFSRIGSEQSYISSDVD